MRRRLLLAVLLAVSGEASAHGSIQGIDHFSGGLLHPLVEPTHLISLVALGLLVGQRGIAKAEAALFCFATGVAAGLICAAFGRSISGMQRAACWLAGISTTSRRSGDSLGNVD